MVMIKFKGEMYHNHKTETSQDSPVPCMGRYVENKKTYTLYYCNTWIKIATINKTDAETVNGER